MEFHRRLRRACPGLKLSRDPETCVNYGRDWTRFREPRPAAVAFPASAEEVRDLVAAAAEYGIPLVPSGGRTGLSGGAVAADGEVVVSLERMRRIGAFDPVDRTLVVEAGVVTAAVQDAARSNGLYYPVSFASEGSSQIGGNIATNAGGIRVLRHGTTRDRVAGLRVVTGRGELLDLNRGLVKNATGYDLRHLFIGSEGTLGIVVEARLRLVESPPPSRVLLLAVNGMAALMTLFAQLRGALRLSAFEFFTDRALDHVRRAHGLAAPFERTAPVYVVAEFDCVDEADEERALASFEQALGDDLVSDGVISQSERQAQDLWRYREGISESISAFTPYKNDLSVTLAQVPAYLAGLEDMLRRECPDFEVVWYGHIGDGNLHLNILKPDGMETARFEARCRELSEPIYALTARLGGSVSAEHGIGLLKRSALGYARSGAEIALMQGIKRTFDPAGIFNPGKLI
ncbi:MAG: FAD-binding oxidoreductase [Xanthomonadales bacterium]